MMKHFKLTLLGTVLAASLLSACGGSSDSPAATTTAATVSGTAATGAAIAGGTVSMNCVSGASATTTTAADGSYSMSVSGITFPCVARVSYGTGNKLQTYVAGAGTANITPLTELILANLIGDTAANGFDKFDAAKAKLLTAAQVTAAIAAIKNYLIAQGISTTDFPADPIGTKFVAKNGTTAGDKADAVLDALAAKLLAGGKKLGDAVGDVAKSGGTSTGGTSTAAGTGAGCTGDALAFFTKNAGTYPSTASSFGGSGTVAGIANGAAATVVVGADCSVKVGDFSLKYKDGSLSPSSGGQIDVSLTGSNSGYSTYEVYGDGTGLTSLNDTRTNSFMNFFLPKK